MDLNKVAIFAKVVETRSFTSAAQALRLPKSSVSRSIAQLEDALGVRLIQRTTRKLHLTEAGAGYYERVSQALATLEEANACAADLHAAPRGTVRVTAPDDLGVHLLGRLVARFVKRHPGIRVHLTLTTRLVNLVEEGFDLAVRAGKLDDSSLVARKVGVGVTWVVASPSYLEKKGTPGTPEDLATHDCVLFRPNGGTALWPLDGPGGKKAIEVSGAIGADDFAFVRKVVLAGAGVSILPAFLCARDVDRGRLVRLLPEYTMRGGALHIVYPSARHIPLRVQLLRDYLLKRLRKMEGLRT